MIGKKDANYNLFETKVINRVKFCIKLYLSLEKSILKSKKKWKLLHEWIKTTTPLCLLSRVQLLDADGIVIMYNKILMDHKNLYRFNEINGIHR